ncbi:MAG TPA: hypothetical protein VEG27_12420 [Usitatibacter sp.]|nr:hypothetical protein [Usitatibacter sp.]
MLERKTRTLGVAAAALVAGIAGSLPVYAESTTSTGGGALSAAAHLDFSVVVPRFLTFRVGTLNATIDVITFTVAAGSVGNATPVAGTGGDAGGGSGSNVSVLANGGQVTITESNNGTGTGLQHATLADTISYSQITTTSSDTTNLQRPVLSDTGGNTSLPVLNAGNVTNRSAVWTYAYANSNVVSAGTYGTSAKGGRVTYTATMP